MSKIFDQAAYAAVNYDKVLKNKKGLLLKYLPRELTIYAEDEKVCINTISLGRPRLSTLGMRVKNKTIYFPVQLQGRISKPDLEAPSYTVSLEVDLLFAHSQRLESDLSDSIRWNASPAVGNAMRLLPIALEAFFKERLERTTHDELLDSRKLLRELVIFLSLRQ